MISIDPARLGPHPSPSNKGTVSLTPGQQDAFESLQEAARKHQLHLDSQPGDIMFMNNLGVLHARHAYKDDKGERRHLVRLWGGNENGGWSIPRSMSGLFDAVFGERSKAVLNRQYPCAPMPEYMESKYSNGTASFIMQNSDDEGIDV